MRETDRQSMYIQTIKLTALKNVDRKSRKFTHTAELFAKFVML